MIYRFRICEDDDLADTAQGWVVAGSEIQARLLVGDGAYFHRVRVNPPVDAPDGTVIVTHGRLTTRRSARLRELKGSPQPAQ